MYYSILYTIYTIYYILGIFKMMETYMFRVVAIFCCSYKGDCYKNGKKIASIMHIKKYLVISGNIW